MRPTRILPSFLFSYIGDNDCTKGRRERFERHQLSEKKKKKKKKKEEKKRKEKVGNSSRKSGKGAFKDN